jgi:peptide/nickel transport system permease protein
VRIEIGPTKQVLTPLVRRRLQGEINVMRLMPRLLLLIPTILGVCLVTFLLMKAVPGDPVYGLVGQHADPRIISQYRENLGLEDGLVMQWVRYMGMIVRGDLGVSYYTKVPVLEGIAQKFPNTLLLASASLGFATLGGICFGMLGAVFHGTWLDRALLFVVTLAMSLPVFWFGLILILVFAYTLGWLPAVGMGDWRHIILPAITLGSRSCAGIARLSRSTLLDAFKEPHVTAAHAKGLSKIRVVLKHAFRNTWIPLITLIGVDFASYLNGSVLTETIFGWDGLGRYAMIAIFRRDYPVILGTVLFGAFLFVLANFVVDAMYLFLDPKLKAKSRV